MIPEIRKNFNASFQQDRYEALLKELNTSFEYPLDFRVSETPLFLSAGLTEKLVQASNNILGQLTTREFAEHSSNAVPSNWIVPLEDAHPAFLQLDFAICQNNSGEFVPQIIELQGFPSLYCFQAALDQATRHHYEIPSNFTPYFDGLDFSSYLKLLKDFITGESSPENVVLLEIDPEKQKTRIDFGCTESMLGIRTVNLSTIVKRKRKLYYEKNGVAIPIDRIYNRVIFDELERKQPVTGFRFTDEVDVHWVGHPNWYFKISKHTLPFLKGEHVPPCFFLGDIKEYPADLENYVLKPLFSFAGLGVEVDVTREKLKTLRNKGQYILQKKVTYAPLIATPDGYSKAEIRMMFIWDDRPRLVYNLVRLSKGAMMGVAFNRDKTWVGSSLAYHPAN